MAVLNRKTKLETSELDKLFYYKDDFQAKTKISTSTFAKRISRGEYFLIRNGKESIVMNPIADFAKEFDRLPALISREELCEFFCVEKIHRNLSTSIGLFKVKGEQGTFVDKLTLSEFFLDLYEQSCT